MDPDVSARNKFLTENGKYIVVHNGDWIWFETGAKMENSTSRYPVMIPAPSDAYERQNRIVMYLAECLQRVEREHNRVKREMQMWVNTARRTGRNDPDMHALQPLLELKVRVFEQRKALSKARRKLKRLIPASVKEAQEAERRSAISRENQLNNFETALNALDV